MMLQMPGIRKLLDGRMFANGTVASMFFVKRRTSNIKQPGTPATNHPTYEPNQPPRKN